MMSFTKGNLVWKNYCLLCSMWSFLGFLAYWSLVTPHKVFATRGLTRHWYTNSPCTQCDNVCVKGKMLQPSMLKNKDHYITTLCGKFNNAKLWYFVKGFPIDSALGCVGTVMTPEKTSSLQIQPFIKFSPKSPSISIQSSQSNFWSSKAATDAGKSCFSGGVTYLWKVVMEVLKLNPCTEMT